jgi:hypothetical protein
VTVLSNLLGGLQRSDNCIRAIECEQVPSRLALRRARHASDTAAVVEGEARAVRINPPETRSPEVPQEPLRKLICAYRR